MDEGRVERKLAAILAADVVGYSSLVRTDEEGTHAAVRQHFSEIVEPNIAGRGGRIFKTMGDGVLAEFGSVVDAIRCAIEIQNHIEERNKPVDTDKRIEFRIGVNLGDVITEESDLHGDGVNVAARLEGLAMPNGICISGSAFEQVRDKLRVGFEDMGEQRVKNINRPVRVYRVLTNPGPAGKNVAVTKKLTGRWKVPAIAAALVVIAVIAGLVSWPLWTTGAKDAAVEDEAFLLPDKPSIAVLPFQNLSDDPRQDYFADGMAEDIITGLSKLSALFVVARNSSFHYRDQSVDVKKVGRELGVAFLLEGSVRRVGNRVRVNAQLVDARTGGHLWAERYDGTLADVFTLQDTITFQIIDALSLTLVAEDRDKLINRGTEIIEAYDAYLKGRWYAKQAQFYAVASGKIRDLEKLGAINLFKVRSTEFAEESFLSALRHDPRFVAAQIAYEEIVSTKAEALSTFSTAAGPDSVTPNPNTGTETSSQKDIRYLEESLGAAILNPGQTINWSNPNNGHNGTLVLMKIDNFSDRFESDLDELAIVAGIYCRKYRRTNITTQAETEYEGTMCRGPSFNWKSYGESQVLKNP